MFIDVTFWRARIGLFNSFKTKKTKQTKNGRCSSLLRIILFAIKAKIRKYSSFCILFTYISFIFSSLVIILPCHYISSAFSKPISTDPLTNFALVPLFIIKLSYVKSGNLLIDIMIFLKMLLTIICMLLFLSGDLELNPGPRGGQLTFATWNLNSLLAREK